MNPRWRLPFIICFLIDLCTSQPTPTTLCSTCSKAPACSGCNINADVITSTSTSWAYWDLGTRPSYRKYAYLQAYLYFTAYSVTLTPSVTGNCVRHTQEPVPLVDAYIVPVPSIKTTDFSGNINVTSDASVVTAEYSTFLNAQYSSFISQLGYQACTAALPPSPVVPALATELSVASVITLPASAPVWSTATPAASSASVPHPHTTQIIIVSVVVPTVGLILLLLGFLGIRRHRKKRSQLVLMSQPDTMADMQIYADRKVELEDEERRKYELDATGKLYEMGENGILEMSSGADTETRLVSFRETHELRGVEHSQELEVPSIAF